MPAFRLMRAEVLELRTTVYVEAARALGGPHVRIMAVHLLPNAVPPIVVQATLGVAEAILTESALRPAERRARPHEAPLTRER